MYTFNMKELIVRINTYVRCS